MVFANLRREERIGLGIAVVLHIALAAALLVQPEKRATIPPAERMTVNLTNEVGLEATAPEPVRESAAAIAPMVAPEPAPPAEPERAVSRRPEPPRTVTTTAPRPRPVPTARPTSRPTAKPTSTPPRPRPTTAARPAGGSRVGADFLDGVGESTTTRESRVPASQIGASAKASLFQAIAKELRPRWQPPSGPEVEQLVTKLRFRLNTDGSLAGRPEVVRQSGLTNTNRPQAGRHAEQAIRAVQLAAPFDLPEQHYEAWKTVTVDFDWKLSQ